MNSNGLPLLNIQPSGKPPESRLNDPVSVAGLVQQLIRADESRARVRAKVKGLVDGNAPYNPSELRNTGQSFRTNINFRESEAFLASALGAFYDVFSEVPTYSTVKMSGADATQRQQWSAIVTEEFDRLQKEDAGFDFLMQQSQHEMVLYGAGPVVFEDTLDWRCRAIRAADLLVPDGTNSNVTEWSVAVVRSRYQAHELYARISNPEAAKTAGWDVEAARKAIVTASPENSSGTQRTWEWHQQQIRNNDLSYSARCDTIRVAHVLYREFPSVENPEGAISHCSVLEGGTEDATFLYRRVNRYADWSQAIHCMYYDRGDGQHHSVKGMGVKMFGAMELKNRLTCSLVDSAFARTQILFQPSSPDAMQKTNVVQMGPYAILPPGFNVVQSNLSGVLDAPLAVSREMETLMQSNLSQYRQRIERPGGNPRTATEVQAILAQQATLGKTQLSRYYEQLDSLFTERFRRATSPNITKETPGGEAALEFQRRCVERGIPKSALSKPEMVRATRTVGQGSSAMRQHVLSELMSLSVMLPESGRQNLLSDLIASRVGQGQVSRYLPEAASDTKKDDQIALAMLEHAALKQGAPAMVTDTQLHAVHVQTHLQAGAEAAGALQSGAVNPVEVAAFLPPLAAHIEEHLTRLEKDPSRNAMVGMLREQNQQLLQVAEMLANNIGQQQQQQQQQQSAPPQPAADSEENLKVMRTQRDEARRDAKLQSDLDRKSVKAKQDLAIKDAKSAHALSKP